MRWWPVLLVYLTQLGQLQMQPGWLIDHPGWPWQASLIGLALLRSLPWALLCWQLKRLNVAPLPANTALCLALWWGGFAEPFEQASWPVAILQLLTVALWVARPHPALILLAAAFWPWHTLPSWQLLVCLGAWKMAPSDSPWRPLLLMQMALRLLGAPALPLEWLALGALWGGSQGRIQLWLLCLLSLGAWERTLNKCLLIPLQECHLSLANLAWPASLPGWAATRGVAFGVTPADLELARSVASQPAVLIHSPLPLNRLQPRLTQRILQRLSGRPDLGFPPSGESWVSHNLSLGSCNTPVRMRGGDQLVPANPTTGSGQVSWKPLQAVGPGSWVEVEVTGAPATLNEEPLALTLTPGRHQLQLPVDTTQVRVKGLAQHSLDLDTALKNLKMVGCQGPPNLTSNSLISANVTLRLEGAQSLWVPYLGAQLSRADLPEGWRETSPLTPVDRLIEPAQQVTLPCYLEVPEMGAAFECDIYWLAPQRRQHLLGRARFTCRPRFPARL